MQFQCPKCSGVVSIDEANLGKTVSCGHCKEIVNAPQSRFDAGVIINDFIIERELGIGGMGVVYLARQITLDRYVALKILKEKYAGDAEFVVQFIREARSAAKLNHPNIVQAYAVGEENGIFFFAMEYVDGETMKEILAREKKIEPQRAAKAIREIAVALDYAWNESKIVHHDIKPDNIMLTKSGKAKLADLGLASMFGDSEVDDSGDEVLGTPQYISPEQLLGDPTDVRSDIYSLGATFYHLVTGSFPYLGETPTEIAHKHVNGVFQPPIERDPSVPQVISDIISKMMARDINLRYQNADDVAKDLKKYLDNSGFVSTASVAVPTVAPSANSAPAAKVAAPQGGLKLSLGGAKYPPVPTPVKIPATQDSSKNESAKITPAVPEKSAAANAGTAASAPKINLGGAAKTAVSAPKVSLGGAKNPSVSVPKVNLGAASQSVPKVNLGAASQSVPKVNLNKPAAVSVPTPAAAPAAPAAPQLGLKKDEPPKAAVKATPPPAEEKKEETEKKQPETKKTESSKKSAKDKKSDGKKKKAKKAADEKKKFPVWIIVIAFIILAAAGGVTFYLYKNKWKAPVIDKIKTWNSERQAAAKSIVRRVPPARKKELTVEELRKDYIPAIEALKKLKGREFLSKTEQFIADKGYPELEKEKAPFAELIDLYNEIDDKIYMEPVRAAGRRAIDAELKKRADAARAILDQQKAVEAAHKAEEQRIAAERLAVEERARREAEAKQQLQKKLDEYREKVAPAYPMLAKMFYEALLNGDKETEFRNKVSNLFIEYSPDGVQMEIHSKLDAYAKGLLNEIKPAKQIYQLMTENTRRFAGHQFGYKGDMFEIISCDFTKGKVQVRALTKRNKTYRFLLQDDGNMKKIVEVLSEKLPREKNYIARFPFYYNLFFGDKQKAVKIAPSQAWKDFFRYYL